MVEQSKEERDAAEWAEMRRQRDAELHVM